MRGIAQPSPPNTHARSLALPRSRGLSCRFLRKNCRKTKRIGMRKMPEITRQYRGSLLRVGRFHGGKRVSDDAAAHAGMRGEYDISKEVDASGYWAQPNVWFQLKTS